MARALVLSLAFAWLAGCGGSNAEEQLVAPADTALEDANTDVADAVSTEDAPAIDSAKGSRCTVTETTVSCTHNVTSLKAGPAIVRDVYWQAPLTDKPSAGYPAVLVYQGTYGGPALTWSTLNKATPFGGFYQGVLHARLLDSGFTVIAPSAAGGSAWQTNTGAKWETTTDYVVINQLLAEIAKGTYGPIDPKRLYATGISSGGYMTSRMAVSYAGTFRALAIQSGSYATCLGPVCNVPDKLPADHPPTLFLHGEIDTTVPISTMRPYLAKLTSQGIATDSAIDPKAGHEWLAVAPDRITDWFLKH